ncbi:MAG: hypothetical protein HYW62_01155 [Candidatus Levybacteria bacterium]|nr:hypothetical protein [Candidatus Levybacteria bacterium]
MIKDNGMKISAENIPNLDQTVMQALVFFIENPPPRIDISQFKSPFVFGSGNAINAGLIIFSDTGATFGDESNYKSVFSSSNKKTQQGELRDVIVISASGAKDAPSEIEFAKQNGLKTTLLTTKSESDAAKIADKVITYKSIAEPYTYNTSTYMGMILSATGENPARIKQLIEGLKLPENFAEHKYFAFVVPDEFMQICPMLDIKDNELFGPHSTIRAYSQGHARHAKFVIRDENELVMTVGSKNEHFGDPNHRWDIDIPNDIKYGGIMALTYYIVGKIQASKPPYFKENIARYAKEDGPAAYGEGTKPFEVIVPGSED